MEKFEGDDSVHMLGRKTVVKLGRLSFNTIQPGLFEGASALGGGEG